MASTTIARIGGVAAAAALAASMLSGCYGQGTSATDDQQANRDYMSQVNQKMEDLDTDLDSFVDAVSREDVVNMRLQADNALKSIDELEDIEVPDALSDVGDSYKNGAEQLKSALDDYVDLYTEIEGATSQNPFDWSTYDSRIASIQSEYDNGVAALKAADEAAVQKE